MRKKKLAMKGQEVCRSPECGRAVVYKRLKLCATCYSFVRRWEFRSAEERLDHLDKLHFWVERGQATFLPSTGNVVPMKKSAKKG